jgi:hypothetical protein
MSRTLSLKVVTRKPYVSESSNFVGSVVSVMGVDPSNIAMVFETTGTFPFTKKKPTLLLLDCCATKILPLLGLCFILAKRHNGRIIADRPLSPSWPMAMKGSWVWIGAWQQGDKTLVRYREKTSTRQRENKRQRSKMSKNK